MLMEFAVLANQILNNAWHVNSIKKHKNLNVWHAMKDILWIQMESVKHVIQIHYYKPVWVALAQTNVFNVIQDLV